MDLKTKTAELASAFKRNAFPSNPLPFLNCLAENVKEHGTDWIRTDEAKALIYIINALAYGQLFTVDSWDEFNRLKEALPKE